MNLQLDWYTAFATNCCFLIAEMVEGNAATPFSFSAMDLYAIAYAFVGSLADRSELTAYEIRLGLSSPEYAFDPSFRLTPTEERVARLVAYGRTSPEISAILAIAPSTARHHVEQVMLKLGIRSRRDVLERARRSLKR